MKILRCKISFLKNPYHFAHGERQKDLVAASSPANINRKKNNIAATLTSRGTASRKHTTMDRRAGNLQAQQRLFDAINGYITS